MRKRVFIAVCGALLVVLATGYWFFQSRAAAQRQALIDTVVNRASDNFRCDDVFIKLDIKKIYNPETRIAAGMEITGKLSENEGQFFWKSFPPNKAERRNFLIFANRQDIVAAKAYAPETKEYWEMRDSRDAEKIAVGDLNYREFRFIASLSRDNCERIEETPTHYILQYHLPDSGGEGSDKEEIPSRVICYVEKDTYLPSSIEFYNTQRKYKDFNLLEKEKQGDRWIIKQGSIKNHITKVETTYELAKVVFNRGIGEDAFTEEALYRP